MNSTKSFGKLAVTTATETNITNTPIASVSITGSPQVGAYEFGFSGSDTAGWLCKMSSYGLGKVMEQYVAESGTSTTLIPGTTITFHSALNDGDKAFIVVADIIEISVDATGRQDTNPIVGQAGVAANAGVMSALTTRVTLATNDTHFGTVGAAADPDGVIHGQLRSIAENIGSIEHTISECDDHTAFSALLDAANIASTTDHVTGTSAVEWDKTAASANVVSGVQDTITSLDLGVYTPADFVMMCINVPNLTDVASVRLELGTDASNYTRWEWADTLLTAGEFVLLDAPIADFDSIVGTGWQQAAVTWFAVSVVYDTDTDTLNNMVVDHVGIMTSESVSLNEILAVLGTPTNTAVSGDSAGTIDAQLRGMNKRLGTIGDGVDADGTQAAQLFYMNTELDEQTAVLGTPTDAAVSGDSAGTIDAQLRGLNKRAGTIGDAADVDGNQAAQLRFIGENIGSIEETIQECDVAADFTALNDAANLDDVANHLTGDEAVEWDKTVGDNVNSGVQDTITAIDLSHFGAADYVMVNTYIPDLSEVLSVRLRLGTDASNYTEWVWVVTELEAATWNTLTRRIGQIGSVTGTGWQQDTVTYVAFLVVFDAAGRTLNNMIVDRLSVVTAEAVQTERNVYLEDTFHTSGDEGNMPLGVRKDTRASLAGTDGYYGPLQLTANGDLRVRDDDLMTNMGAIGDGADVDGNVAGQLRYTGEAVENLKTDFGTVGEAADVDGAVHGQLRSIAQALEIIDDWDAVVDATASTDGPQVKVEYREIDGAALPAQTAVEGRAVNLVGSAQGIQFVYLTDKDGAKTPYDSANNVLRTSRIDDARQATYTEEIQSATTITAAETVIGGEINTLGYNRLTIWIDLDIGDSTSWDLIPKFLRVSGGDEHRYTEWSDDDPKVLIQPEFRATATAKYPIILKIEGINIVKLYGDETGGTPNGTVQVGYTLTNN